MEAQSGSVPPSWEMSVQIDNGQQITNHKTKKIASSPVPLDIKVMTENQKRKLKIAFIHQPLSDIRPPVSLTGIADSVGLIIDEVARRLAQSHEVIEYCVFHRGQKVVEQFDGVEYRRVSKFFDRFSNRIMREIDRT